MLRYLIAPLAGVAALFAGTATAAAEAPKVVVSIKPLHSLVAGVMGDLGEPFLLVQGAGSPHSYSLRPSEARALENADLVVWVGPGLESFLEKPLGALAGKARIVELAEAEGVTLRDTREGGAWEAHDHEEHGHGEHGHGAHAEGEHAHDEHAHDQHAHDEHAHDGHAHDGHAEAAHEEHHAEHHGEHEHGAHDMHVWLDPGNAAAVVRAIRAALSELDPRNAARYGDNATALEAKIAALDGELAQSLAAVKERPFVVFHDAYQYFERHYGLNGVGSITLEPDQAPGARRLAELRHRIEELDAACVFSEPQFEPALVETLTEGLAVKTGVLDPLGAALPAGEAAYFTLMRDLADSLVTCLEASS
ncbi:MAG: zinc ABC transporter substrate-binding protein [Kiloniellales bacterium]